MITAAIKPSSLPYATEKLKEKTEITTNMIGKVDISGTFISNDGDNLIQNKNKIIGKYVQKGYDVSSFVPSLLTHLKSYKSS